MKRRKVELTLSDAHPAYSYIAILTLHAKLNMPDVFFPNPKIHGTPVIFSEQSHRVHEVISEPGYYRLFYSDDNPPLGFSYEKPLEITVLDKRTNAPAPVTEHETKEPVTVKKEHPVLGRWHAHVQLEYCKPGESKHAEIESLEGFDPRVKHDREHVHRMLDEYLNVIEKRLIAIETNPDEIAHALDEHNEYSFKENGFQIFSSIDRHRQ